jgi:hypothetical protein
MLGVAGRLTVHLRDEAKISENFLEGPRPVVRPLIFTVG